MDQQPNINPIIMNKNSITLLITLATATALHGSFEINVGNYTPNGVASGGTGTGNGVLTSSLGSISSNIGLPVTTYTVSNLDFSSLGGTATESFTFTVSYSATGDENAAVQFNPFGNVSVTGGGSANQVNTSETLTATIALASSTFAGVSLAGFTETRAGGVGGTDAGLFAWANGGSFSIAVGSTQPTFLPADAVTSLTLSVSTGDMNLEGFRAQFVAVPEPSTYAALVGFGALAFVALRRRKA